MLLEAARPTYYVARKAIVGLDGHNEIVLVVLVVVRNSFLFKVLSCAVPIVLMYNRKNVEVLVVFLHGSKFFCTM